MYIYICIYIYILKLICIMVTCKPENFQKIHLFYRNLKRQLLGPNFHKNAPFSDNVQFFQNSPRTI